MIIKNAEVFGPDRQFHKTELTIEEGKIVEGYIIENDDEIIDATGLLAIPGLVDIHLHGALGHDFCDAKPDGIETILDYELQNGIMAVCPATMTFPEEKLVQIIDAALDAKDYDGGADMLGINMEGPFISPEKVAAQNPEYVTKADPAMFERIRNHAKGLIKIVDIAPEYADNMDFIDRFKDEVIISLAHTGCDYNKAKEAFRRGANHLTHMFNGMNDIAHRAPGPILAACEEGAFSELICDGVHNHDAVVRMAFKIFDEDKLVLISDSMMATGLDDGYYELGGQKVTVIGNRCTLTDKPDIIAGSNSNLFECLKHAVKEAGIPLEQAIPAATINPAKSVGADRKYGSLEVGKYGNVILLDQDLNIKTIIKKGKII